MDLKRILNIHGLSIELLDSLSFKSALSVSLKTDNENVIKKNCCLMLYTWNGKNRMSKVNCE